MAAERIFVDTNVLVYANQIRSPFHQAASRRLEAVSAQFLPCVSRQVLREYFGTVTRPQSAGPALDPETAAQRVASFVEVFKILDEGLDVFDRLMDLAVRYRVSGKQIHDANIVATMSTSGVRRILTANPADFRRFADIIDIESLS